MFAPRRTIRRIIDQDPDRFGRTILFLAIVSAILRDLDLRGFREVTDILDPWLLLAVTAIGVLAVVVFMIAFFYVLSFSALLVGRWFEGTASFREVRSAFVWSLAPWVWALFYLVPELIVVLASGGPGQSIGPPRMLLGGNRIEWSGGTIGSSSLWWMLVRFVLDTTVLVWFLVIASRTLGEAHRFSSWRGLGTLLLAIVLPFATVAILVFVTWVYFQRVGG